MEGKSVKELKVLAREKGIKGYYRMRKAELIEALEEESEIFYSANDQFIPEVDIPIPAPSRVTQMRNLATSVAAPVKIEGIEIFEKKCSHKIREKSCKDCGICIHDRVVYMCKDCNDEGILSKAFDTS